MQKCQPYKVGIIFSTLFLLNAFSLVGESYRNNDSVVGEDIFSSYDNVKYRVRDEILKGKKHSHHHSSSSSSSSSDSADACEVRQMKTIKRLPVTLDESGVYYLSDNVELRECEIGIIIDADDVVLDLCGHAIQGGEIAIVVKSDVSHVLIKNGKISASSAEGIVLLRGCSDITLCDINVVGCNLAQECGGVAGVLLDGTGAESIRDCCLQNVTVSGCTGAGVRLQFCEDCRVQNCSVTRCMSSVSLDALGFYVSGAATFDHCEASHMLSTYADRRAVGFFTELSKGVRFEKCKASYNTTEVATSSVGFHIKGSECVVCQDCCSNSNTSSIENGSGGGFFLDESLAVLIKDCFACLNGKAEFNGYGFLVVSSPKSDITGCLSMYNLGDGFRVSTGPLAPSTLSCSSMSAIQNCIAVNNKGVGFVTNVDYVVFISNFASLNGPPNYNLPPVSSWPEIKYLTETVITSGFNIDWL